MFKPTLIGMLPVIASPEFSIPKSVILTSNHCQFHRIV